MVWRKQQRPVVAPLTTASEVGIKNERAMIPSFPIAVKHIYATVTRSLTQNENYVLNRNFKASHPHPPSNQVTQLARTSPRHRWDWAEVRHRSREGGLSRAASLASKVTTSASAASRPSALFPPHPGSALHSRPGFWQRCQALSAAH